MHVDGLAVSEWVERGGVRRLELLRDRALLHVLFYSGMRRAEVGSLNRLDVQDGWAHDALVIVGPIGERALIYIVGKYAEHARVADVSPHDLRHRFGYRMARLVPLHRLAQIMGHDSLDTTLRYVRGTQQDLQQAVETIAWA